MLRTANNDFLHCRVLTSSREQKICSQKSALVIPAPSLRIRCERLVSTVGVFAAVANGKQQPFVLETPTSGLSASCEFANQTSKVCNRPEPDECKCSSQIERERQERARSGHLMVLVGQYRSKHGLKSAVRRGCVKTPPHELSRRARFQRLCKCSLRSARECT